MVKIPIKQHLLKAIELHDRVEFIKSKIQNNEGNKKSLSTQLRQAIAKYEDKMKAIQSIIYPDIKLAQFRYKDRTTVYRQLYTKLEKEEIIDIVTLMANLDGKEIDFIEVKPLDSQDILRQFKFFR